MLIPKEPVERLALYTDLIDKCKASMSDRRAFYTVMRNYFLYGSHADTEVIYNKCYPHLDLLVSFLYSQESTRLSLELGAAAEEVDYKRLTSMSEVLQEEFHDSNGDKVFAVALMWALVFNTTLVKLVWKNGVSPSIVEPGMFGVLREDVPMLDRQEACVHVYHSSMRNLETRLSNHIKRDELLAKISAGQKKEPGAESAVTRIITSAVSPTIIGNVDVEPMIATRAPGVKVNEELVEIAELYAYDEDKADYRVVTIAQPDIIIFDRTCEEMFVKNELPFVQICPNPTFDNFWGDAEMERLRPLQDLLNERLWDIQKILGRQAEPSYAGYGLMGQPDEIKRALNMRNGYIAADMNFKLEPNQPAVPDDLWADVQRISEMFSETSGMSATLQGRGEAGVRSMSHASELARYGSSRSKKRAMVIEDALEKMASLYLKMIRRYERVKLKDDDGTAFIPQQFTERASAKVDAHSSSPAFVEDLRAMAFELHDRGVISGEALLEMVQPPMVEKLKREWKAMEVQRQQEAAANPDAAREPSKKRKAAA